MESSFTCPCRVYSRLSLWSSMGFSHVARAAGIVTTTTTTTTSEHRPSTTRGKRQKNEDGERRGGGVGGMQREKLIKGRQHQAVTSCETQVFDDAIYRYDLNAKYQLANWIFDLRP